MKYYDDEVCVLTPDGLAAVAGGYVFRDNVLVEKAEMPSSELWWELYSELQQNRSGGTEKQTVSIGRVPPSYNYS